MAIASNASDEQHSLQRSTILRVYNYYRTLIAFLFLFLFLDSDFNTFVGEFSPDLFRTTSLTYLGLNIIVGIGTLFVSAQTLSRTAPSFIIIVIDIICLSLLITASGGVSSGLGNFLIFTCAFSGSLVLGRMSSVLPAIAVILLFYGEFYLFFYQANDLQNFFQAGVLGVIYFVANIFFQTASLQLRKTETEVITLEQTNQLIIDTMKTGVVVIASDGSIKSINHAAKAFLRIPSVPEIARDRLPYRLADKLNDWRTHRLADSVTFHIRESSQPLIASFSTLGSTTTAEDTLIFIEDSSEVQHQAQQFKLAALGRLSASIAHEIRNPLGAISHAAQLLAESQELSKGDARLSEIIQNHCLRMNDVIEHVLNMSRRKNATPQTLNIGTWTQGFIADFSAGQTGVIYIDTDIASDAISINADPIHLSQILGNLCQNGLRYSLKKTGEARILIRCKIDTTSMMPYLEVIDYGEGVAESLIPHLFEPFYTTEATGTGLGLYLSMELCEANSARLSYSQASSGGSCFRVSFLEQYRQ